MLVLSRKQGERFCIGSEIEVVVLEVNKYRGRVGISAPIEIPVHRQELVQRLDRENRDVNSVGEQHSLGSAWC